MKRWYGVALVPRAYAKLLFLKLPGLEGLTKSFVATGGLGRGPRAWWLPRASSSEADRLSWSYGDVRLRRSAKPGASCEEALRPMINKTRAPICMCVFVRDCVRGDLNEVFPY